MKTAIITWLFFYSLLCFNNLSEAQEYVNNFNLDFEKNLNQTELPDGWLKWGTEDYLHKQDSSITFAGNYSICIGSTNKTSVSSFGCVAYQIPANYEAVSITLTGYMKTEDVEDGFAGLLLRVDGINGGLAFENMKKSNIHGTNDWTKYRITLPYYSQEADKIFIAGLLSGTGKAWFDKFELFFNGRDISEVTQITKEPAKADLDNEFDSGSNIQFDNINEWQIKNLFKVGKVWGFLKYYHPEIAKGNINWDYELIRILPEVMKTKNDNTINGILQKWIKKLGEFSEEKEPVELSPLKLEADLDWITDDDFLGEELSSILEQVNDSKKTDEHYYIRFVEGVGTSPPIFINENPYPNLSYSDDGLKLVGLFRYWNSIQYYFPHRNLINENWDSVLKAFISKFIAADDELSYKLTIWELAVKIQDTHANYWQSDYVIDKFLGLKAAPIEVKFVENHVVVTNISDQLNESSGIAIGDIITEVNNIPIEKLISEKIKYCPASNMQAKQRILSKRLLRTNSDSLLLAIQKNESTYYKTAACVSAGYVNYGKNDKPSYRIINGNIGYIYPGTLKQGEIDKIMATLQYTRGLIIDLRCYPSEFIVYSLGKYLMPGPTEFVKFTKGSIPHPGDFIFQPTLRVGESRDVFYKNKIIILVNETTHSQAEYTAMAFRAAPNAVVIGSTTSGANGNVSKIIWPGDIKTQITGIGVYYPNGEETQRVGIVPDYEIKPTIVGIKKGKDELLDKAVELINNN